MNLNIDTDPALVEELRQRVLQNYAAWTNNSGQPDYQTLSRFYEDARQHATHVWRKQSGQWVIVHEHLTAGAS